VAERGSEESTSTEGAAIEEPATTGENGPTPTPASVIIVEDDQPAPSAAEPAPTPASVIIVEGDQSTAETDEPSATREPRPDRERRRDRQATEEAGA
jgi:hypothetical protein